MPWVTVSGVPHWVRHQRLLSEAPWTRDDQGRWTAELTRPEAADLMARLRGLGMGGQPLVVDVQPRLSRQLVRRARTEDARRRRDTSPGFTHPKARLDEEGRFSLTPEQLAFQMGQRAAGKTVVDAGCGCGGNTIGFARGGAEVTAIELDPQRAQLARHNIEVYGVTARVITGDLHAHLPQLKADILFVDPPWGPHYDRICCVADDFPQLRVALAHRANFGALWFKLPPSFDPTSLPGCKPAAAFGHAGGDRQRVKFVLVRL